LSSGFEDIDFRVEGVKAFGAGGIEQHGRSGDKEDIGAAEHFARDERGSELKGISPAEAGTIEKLTGGFENCGVERLLHHAGCFDAEDFESGSGARRADVSGALAAADRGVDFERSGGGYELAIVLD
jgi:hypothetical protein